MGVFERKVEQVQRIINSTPKGSVYRHIDAEEVVRYIGVEQPYYRSIVSVLRDFARLEVLKAHNIELVEDDDSDDRMSDHEDWCDIIRRAHIAEKSLSKWRERLGRNHPIVMKLQERYRELELEVQQHEHSFTMIGCKFDDEWYTETYEGSHARDKLDATLTVAREVMHALRNVGNKKLTSLLPEQRQRAFVRFLRQNERAIRQALFGGAVPGTAGVFVPGRPVLIAGFSSRMAKLHLRGRQSPSVSSGLWGCAGTRQVGRARWIQDRKYRFVPLYGRLRIREPLNVECYEEAPDIVAARLEFTVSYPQFQQLEYDPNGDGAARTVEVGDRLHFTYQWTLWAPALSRDGFTEIHVDPRVQLDDAASSVWRAPSIWPADAGTAKTIRDAMEEANKDQGELTIEV